MQKEKITVSSQDIVSIPEAAKQLGVAPSTVYRWIYKGKVTPFRIGTQVFLTATDLKELKKRRSKRG